MILYNYKSIEASIEWMQLVNSSVHGLTSGHKS